MKNLVSMFGLLVFVCLFSGFSSYGDIQTKDRSINKSKEETSELNANFAFSLYSKLSESNDKNIFISPFSVSSAMAMAYQGSAGITESEMKKTLCFQDRLKTAEIFWKLNSTISEDSKDGLVIKAANALWLQKDYRFLDSFLDTVKKYFGGGLNQVDFTKNPEDARIKINDWAEKETENKIKNLVPEGVIRETTRLLITNAVYFKGNWKYSFKKGDTESQPFFISARERTNVPFMTMKEKFLYAENDTLQMLSMPYLDGKVSMIIILPKEKNGLKKIEKSFDFAKFAELKKQLRKREIKIFIPKFKLEESYDLVNAFKSMELISPFSEGQADFSGIDGTKNFFISEIIHKTFIDVNEEGTEAAAAATAVIMQVIAMPIEEEPIFRADHPFMFFIYHESTGTILFMGRFAIPTAIEN